MGKTTRKIVLIGAGAVGTSFLYAAANQKIAEEFGIIDLNENNAKGQKLDLEDMVPTQGGHIKFISGDYRMLDDADIVVITAGRPQKEGETRLNMTADNAMIMKDVATRVKATKFNGITLIASNPVDVMTLVYQKVTEYDAKKVISSSCSLDTNRLRILLASKFEVNPSQIGAFVLGEHGDSSLATLDHGTIMGIPFKDYLVRYGLSTQSFDKLQSYVRNKAYEIISLKRATFYGVGSALTEICKSILNDEEKVFSVGTLLSGEYGESGIYLGIPCVVGDKGIEQIFEFPLSSREKDLFKASAKAVKEASKVALDAIK